MVNYYKWFLCGFWKYKYFAFVECGTLIFIFKSVYQKFYILMTFCLLFQALMERMMLKLFFIILDFFYFL